MLPAAPTIEDVYAAAERIARYAVRTPLLRSPVLDDRVGRRVVLKPESMQRTGSFKFRGACNFILQIPPEERSRGVVAYSSGNHAQGVAAAAAIAGVAAAIVMPEDAPEIKRARTAALGAEVVPYDRYTEDRHALGVKVAEERGATLVPPYEHPWTVAGQATTGLEIAAQAKDHAVELEHTVVPCGGGGLTAGIALAMESLAPHTVVHSAEPARYDDHARSLEAGHRVENDPGDFVSICDALLAMEPGEFTFSINSPRLGQGMVVDDDSVLRAMAFAVTELKLVVEPGGAAALASLLNGSVPGTGPVCVVLSGGNVDPAMLVRALANG